MKKINVLFAMVIATVLFSEKDTQNLYLAFFPVIIALVVSGNYISKVKISKQI